MSEIINCDCGSNISSKYYHKHIKSMKCKTFHKIQKLEHREEIRSQREKYIDTLERRLDVHQRTISALEDVNIRTQTLYEESTVMCLMIISANEILQERKHIDLLNIPTIENKQEHECSICLENIAENEIIHNINCKHRFHRSCLLISSQNNKSCPLCRVSLPPI